MKTLLLILLIPFLTLASDYYLSKDSIVMVPKVIKTYKIVHVNDSPDPALPVSPLVQSYCTYTPVYVTFSPFFFYRFPHVHFFFNHFQHRWFYLRQNHYCN